MSSMTNLNEKLYLDVNKFAVDTPWAHTLMATYSHYLAVALLAILLLSAWWKARSEPSPDLAVSRVLWAAGGTVLAWVVAHYALKPLFAEKRPYIVLGHVEVLLTKTYGYSFPSGHATVAGGVITGLWLARRHICAVLATFIGLFLAFGRVYTGMHYPGDVVGGLIFGSLFLLVLYKPAVFIIDRIVRQIGRNRVLGHLVQRGSLHIIR